MLIDQIKQVFDKAENGEMINSLNNSLNKSFINSMNFYSNTNSFNLNKSNEIDEIIEIQENGNKKYSLNQMNKFTQNDTMITMSIIIREMNIEYKEIEEIIIYLLYKKIITRRIIHVEKQKKIEQEELDLGRMTPWSKFDGSIDTELFKSLIHKLKSLIYKYPSISIENLCKKFPFHQMDTLYLIQYLCDENEIEIKDKGLYEDGLYVFPKINSFFI